MARPPSTRRASTLLEVLIATLLVGVTAVVFLAITQREMTWSRDLDDRAKALALAENALELIEFGYRDTLNNGTPEPGGLVLHQLDRLLPDGHLIYGTGLFDWVAKQRKRGSFDISCQWQATTQTPLPLARARIRVEWSTRKGEARWLELTRCLTR